MWGKQYYGYDVSAWLDGDPGQPPPPKPRKPRNTDWRHLFNDDIHSMPDKWEYPWYAAWDSAFHCVPIALIDPDFAKEQLVLFLREWYMHPNGQMPAYEWAFGDVNPPVHAWAVWRVYKIEARQTGTPDRAFLERCSTSSSSTSPGGSTARTPMGAMSFRAAFWDSTTSGSSTAARPSRRAATARAVRRHQLDGDVLPEHAPSRSSSRGRIGPTRTWRRKFFEHFVYIADAMHDIEIQRRGTVGRARRLLLRRAAPARRPG